MQSQKACSLSISVQSISSQSTTSPSWVNWKQFRRTSCKKIYETLKTILLHSNFPQWTTGKGGNRAGNLGKDPWRFMRRCSGKGVKKPAQMIESFFSLVAMPDALHPTCCPGRHFNGLNCHRANDLAHKLPNNHGKKSLPCNCAWHHLAHSNMVTWGTAPPKRDTKLLPFINGELPRCNST